MPPSMMQSDASDGPIRREKIVISGMAGLYPNSHNVKELSDILYNKINPVEKTDRWNNTNMPEVPQYLGKIPDLAHFDAQFFKVHYRLCELMDPMSRKLLEQTYQALFDAGQNPEELSGKKVGVYVGSGFSETEKAIFYVYQCKSGLGIAGCSKSMFANRISYYLNLKGPSISIDESCCSSIAALEMAYDAIARGECESAIVGASNLCLHPQKFVHYGRVINICMDGKTKSFDAHADGCSKSEAISVVYLQKAKDARRIYAHVVKAKSEYMSLPEFDVGAIGGFKRNPADITRFLETFYKDVNVSPNEVQYIEAFGAASPECDKIELDTIDELFCKERSKPLMVGSVMSNIGYMEAASGLSAVTKVLLGYHVGKLAGNLYYKTPRDDVAAIREGRIEILADHKELVPTYYTAVNGLSVTGNTSHVLLQGFNKQKDPKRYKASFPRIVLCSGRQETSVQKMFDDLNSRPIDPEEHALLHSFHEFNVSGHLGRGFLIYDTNKDGKTVKIKEECAYFDKGRRPLWFVYSGMGSQWVGMGKDLMRIPVFAAAIERCHRVLEPKGLNIIDIITSDDKKMFDNILNSFVGINAIQIGLTDVLRAMDIVPDNIIGHSVGEMGCAYADGCLTAEEAILCAYSRGLVSVQTKFIRGSMAAVGLGYKEISKLVPPEIEIACHNSAESCTISGPEEIMSQFVHSLTSEGIFAKEVPCSNIAYHSRYIADAGPGLLKYMKEIIKTPRLRSPKWLSTSIPRERWDEPLAQYSSAEYHTNNLLNPVLFEETSQLILPDSVLIEVAPHGLLQAILKRSLPISCTLLPLTRRGHPENSVHLLEAVGRLYMEGFNPKVRTIYPKVEFPVSTSTPMLSHLVDWVYQEEWTLQLPIAANKRAATLSQNTISTYDIEHIYLKGHVIRGKNLYPFSAALVSVWDTLAMSLNKSPKKLSVQFKNVHFHSQPIMHKQRQLHIYVAIQKGTGYFEVLNDDSLMMTGTIIPEINIDADVQNIQAVETKVDAEDIYKLLHAKECHYVDEFRSIHSANESLTEAEIEWKDNWVTFLDGLIQLNILRRKHNTVSKLNYVRNFSINVEDNFLRAELKENRALVKATVLELKDITICGGVIIENLKFVDLPQHKENNIKLKSCEFVPLFPTEITDSEKALHAFIQIVADNLKKDSINVAEVINYDTIVSEYTDIKDILTDIAGVKVNYTKIYSMSSKTHEDLNNVDLLLVTDLLNNEKIYQKFKSFLKQDTFLINKRIVSEPQERSLYQVVSAHNVGYAKFELAVWKPMKTNLKTKLSICTPRGLSIKDTLGGDYYLPVEETSNPELDAELKIKRVGDLDSLYWVEASPITNYTGIDVKVNYIGVNIVYVNKLLGSLFNEDDERNKSVIDFSGISKRGTRLMGLLQSDTISTRVDANPEFLWPVPEHWTQEEAATVPLAYSMAFYYLFIKAQIKSYYTICVEGGAGALGQAIISVALAHGCKVFVTVSKSSKKQLLQKIFPLLKGEHIIDNVKGLRFVDTILSATEGKGCDVIISCAKGQLKTFCLQCLGFNGVLIDTALIHEHEDYKFGMNYLTKQRAYLPCDFSTIFQSKYAEEVKLLRVLMIDGIRRGYVKPLTRSTFEVREAARAFRLQAACNNRGRVLLDLQQLKLNVEPRLKCSSISWQLIMSDNDVLALKLTEKLIKRGATKIMVVLNSPSKCAEVQKRLWENEEIELKLMTVSWMANNISDIMKDCTKDGLFESIFIIASDEKSANVFENVNTFAAVVATCTSLKNVALITTSRLNNKVERWIGDNGHSEIFKKIILPEISEMCDDHNSNIKNAVSINNAMDALERALCLQKKIIFAHTSNAPRETLFEVILKLADITQRSSGFVLRDLKLDNSKLLAIQGYLRDIYDVCLDVKDIQNLSKETIDQLEESLSEYDFNSSQGVATYFPKLHSDELLYTAEMIFMPTLAFSSMYHCDIDMNRTHMCIVPGVEGHYDRFNKLCERLKLPAIVLQPGIDKPFESISDQANRYIDMLKKKSAVKDNFFLLGYESGVLVALKMAAILEENGLTGTVFCIGGSPKEIIEDFRNNLKCYKSDEELQIGVLKHVYSLITKEDPDILNTLCNKKDWSEKVNACMDKMRGKLPYSIQYTRNWISLIYEKLSSLMQSTLEVQMLESQIISLRPQYSASTNMSLQDYSKKKVKLYQIEAPLPSAHLDLMCTAIINMHLDRDTLNKFAKRNICQPYAIVNEIITI